MIHFKSLWWFWLFIILGIGLIIKKIYGLYLVENLYITLLIAKDFYLSYFLAIICWKFYKRKKEKDRITNQIKLYESNLKRYQKLYENGTREYVDESDENSDKLTSLRDNLWNLERNIPFFDNIIVFITIGGCILQIVCLFAQKI